MTPHDHFSPSWSCAVCHLTVYVYIIFLHSQVQFWQRWVFKDYIRLPSDQCRRENRFLRAEVGIEIGFHAGVGRNADGNHL